METVIKLIEEQVQTDFKPVLIQCALKHQDTLCQIVSFLNDKDKQNQLCPQKQNIFRAFGFFDINDTKLVIVGQDPYHNGTADGLAFSSINKFVVPVSLNRIFCEVRRTEGSKTNLGNLDLWAEQGTLLINSALTTLKGKPNAHQTIWKKFTEEVIQTVSQMNDRIVYALWGNYAKSLTKLIKPSPNNLILTWTHPSPLSRFPFVGCDHFKLCNEHLKKTNQDPIDFTK